MSQMKCNIIVAIDSAGAIGKDNALLCHLPADLKHFKELTMGYPVVMGRKTWESLPKKPLPGRTNYVITSSNTIDQAIVIHDVKDVLNMIDREFFVIGGASVYQQFLPYAHKLYITRIHHTFKYADVFFPHIDSIDWTPITREYHPSDERHQYPFTFETLIRNNL